MFTAGWDYTAVFSGSATIVDGIGAVILYPGLCVTRNESSCPNTAVTSSGISISIARPANASDPLIVEWTKTPYPVVNRTSSDPSTAWRTAGVEYRFTLEDTSVYVSDDFQTWRRATGEPSAFWPSDCPDFFELAPILNRSSTVKTLPPAAAGPTHAHKGGACCTHCGGRKWLYANNSLPHRKQPVLSSVVATTLACEAKCESIDQCAGFTRKDAGGICFFYSKSQVSGLFSHSRPDVSWHPSPNATVSHKTDDESFRPPVQPLPFVAGGAIPGMVFPSPINSFESAATVTTAVANFSLIINDNGINEGGGNCSREGEYQSLQAAAYKAAAAKLGKRIGTGVYRQGSIAM